MTNRRTILAGMLGVAVTSLSPFARVSYAGLAAGASMAPELTRLNDNLSVLSGFGGNVVVRSDSDGQILVDAGAPGLTDGLLARLAELPGGTQGVRTLFNTHWHPDQTGGNAVLSGAGATIVAHATTRLFLATEHWDPIALRYIPALEPAAHPTETFYTEHAVTFGGERIESGFLPYAHTSGDIYVFFRDSDVLAVGDAVSPERDPIHDWFGGGWLGGRVDSLEVLLALAGENTRIVPAFGPVMTRAQLQTEYEAMLELFERLVVLVRQGLSADDLFEEGVLEGLGRSWDDPQKFLYDAHKGMWMHHNRLGPDIV